MRIAIAQILSTDHDRSANLQRQRDAIASAKDNGADFVLFPEMFDIGYTQPQGKIDEWRSRAITPDDAYIDAMKAVYAEMKIWGTICYMEQGVEFPRNSVMVVNSSGECVCNYSKVHLFEPFENDACCEPGDQFCVFDFPLADGTAFKVGTMICADRDFPESARVLMKMGAELIISPNACPLNNILSDMLRIRAFENAVAVATTNYPEPKWDGHSAVISPQGEFVARLGTEEEIAVVDLDVNGIRKYRATTNWGDSYRKEHTYGPLLKAPIPPAFKDRKNKIGVQRNRDEMANKAVNWTP